MRPSGGLSNLQKLRKEFECKVGHTSEDGKVTLEFVECHADCGKGPVVMVGEDEYTDIDPEKAAKWLPK
jgi:NADH-quinone oxidoreductase subunit E